MKTLRFDLGTRVMHWSHAVIFIWLLATGIGLFLTPKSLLGNPLLRTVHIYAFVPFISVPFIVYYSGGTSLLTDIRELISWTQDDYRWFIKFVKFENPNIPGKFNAGQKVNFFFTLLLITGLSLSGFIIWMKSWFSVSYVELSFVIHDFLAEFSILLLIGHIILALYNHESIQGIIYGHVEAEWARKHFPDWFFQKNEK